METIKVSGMSCVHCVGSVTEALEALAGITEITIDLASGTVQYNSTGSTSREDIKAAITKIGFTPSD